MYSRQYRLSVPLRVSEQLQRDGVPDHDPKRLAWGSDLHNAAEKARHLAAWEWGCNDEDSVVEVVLRAEDAAAEVLQRRWSDVEAIAEALASCPGEMLTGCQLLQAMRFRRSRR